MNGTNVVFFLLPLLIVALGWVVLQWHRREIRKMKGHEANGAPRRGAS